MLEAVEAVRPTALIGVRRHDHSLKAGALAGELARRRNAADKRRTRRARRAKPRLFTQAVLQKMGECAQAPLIFALSHPENIAECTAKEAYDATGGRCVFAGGCQVEPFVHAGRESRSAPARRPTSSPGSGWG